MLKEHHYQGKLENIQGPELGLEAGAMLCFLILELWITLEGGGRNLAGLA